MDSRERLWLKCLHVSVAPFLFVELCSRIVIFCVLWLLVISSAAVINNRGIFFYLWIMLKVAVYFLLFIINICNCETSLWCPNFKFITGLFFHGAEHRVVLKSVVFMGKSAWFCLLSLFPKWRKLPHFSHHNAIQSALAFIGRIDMMFFMSI